MFVARNGRVSSEEVAVGQGFDCQKTRKKPHFTSPNLLFTYPKPHFTYPKPQVSALPRTGNTITAMQKQYYRSAEMMCPRCGNRTTNAWLWYKKQTGWRQTLLLRCLQPIFYVIKSLVFSQWYCGFS